MKTFKIRIIAYIAFGIINLVGFVYLVGETRYQISTATPQYEAAAGFPQNLSSWFYRRP
ncbi:MAG TPA: hypothetical protein VHS80_16375 [Chthoniobacterales bacterium]|jgi:hypothetical protein|nr:hypothetical protein [Chthoniobacterales bacterium]